MGLFGSKKVYVSSTVQNMAGDELNRPDYLKTTVVGNVIANNKKSLGDVIQQSYLKGPGINLRNFFRWAEDNYDGIGMPTAKLGIDLGSSSDIVAPYITLEVGSEAKIQDINIDVADYSYWAEQWMMIYHSALLDTDWVVDYNETSGEIEIIFEDTTTASFTPTGFNRESQYIYVTYLEVLGATVGDTVVDGITILGEEDDFPPTTGWTLQSSSDTPNNYDLDTLTIVDVVYSDATPPEHTEDTDTLTVVEYTTYNRYQRLVYQGIEDNPDNPEIQDQVTIEEWLIFDELPEVVEDVDPTIDVVVEDLGGGVTKTTTTTVYEDTLKINRSYTESHRRKTSSGWFGPRMFIYEIGSGTTELDELYTETANETEFFPFIPIRLNNTFISDSYFPDAYALTKKALRKSVGGRYNKIVDELSELETLDDIDHAYAVFGVAANVLDNAAKKYIFNFFTHLVGSSETTETDYTDWASDSDTFNLSNDEWLDWYEGQKDSGSPLFEEPEPTYGGPSSIPTSSLRISGSGTFGLPNSLDMRLFWQSMTYVTGSGLAKVDAEKDEVWYDTDTTDSFDGKIWKKDGVMTKSAKLVDRVRMYHQIDDDNWEAIDIIGMVHQNYIYKKKYVEIALREALEDAEDSGFIVPLHYPTYKDMSLIDGTQMSTACTFLVFNSYVVKKTGLLGSLFFKILLIVVIIAIVVFAPQLAPSLVQAAASTGAALGLTGTMALIAGAAINAIAAMIVTSLLTKAAIAVFGEKLGTIIGIVASILAANGFSNLASGQGFTINFGNIMTAQNLTMLTSTIGNVYAKFVAFDAMAIVEKTQDLVSEFEKKSKEISELYAENFGYGNGIIDPLNLLDSSNMVVEFSETFLSRTLMTGSDIADLSMNMLGSFADLTLSNKLPVT